MRTLAGAGATDRRTDEWRAELEGGPASAAELSRPHMAMADDADNVYIADKEAHAIRRVDGAGRITTVAGTGRPGPLDDTPGPPRPARSMTPTACSSVPTARCTSSTWSATAPTPASSPSRAP